MTALEEIKELSHELPLGVLEDINQRCKDWLASGGKPDDPYIHQQLRYATSVIQNKGVN